MVSASGGPSAVACGVSTGQQHNRMNPDPASTGMDNFKTPELTKENGLQEDGIGESSMYDERQPKRRKRTLMNNEQIDELEKALVDEPEMHNNPVLLQSWSEKLSLQVIFFHFGAFYFGPTKYVSFKMKMTIKVF
jgi:hypothetical protein